MKIYGLNLKVDVGDELSVKEIEEWIQDALDPAARAISIRLEGKLASKADCEDVLFSMPPQRITLTEGNVLIFRFKQAVSDEHADHLAERVKKVFGDKFKTLILESGAEMVIGEIVEKEGTGG